MKFSLMLLPLLLFSFSSHGIYHWETQKELKPSQVKNKYWILVDSSCHLCASLMLQLETFCKGKKPSPKKLGFFAIGFNPAAIRSHLKSFKKGYEVYLGSSNEFYQAYRMQGSPSLLIKKNQKALHGKKTILKKISKFQDFCKS
ncbi:MAG: hypothetical protein ACR2M7_01275 [Bdellovibrionales bacterium]